ncbi:MAG: hypothetical protein HQL83_13720 [Magnetococcales bacterium]|nr:hypothetical protein [Magnetococcales bacterium]
MKRDVDVSRRSLQPAYGRTMTSIIPPPNINAQSDDNRVGFMFVMGLLLLYVAWKMSGMFGVKVGAVPGLPGMFFAFLAVRRLLRPGCKMILRINHGGITDFRLSDQVVPWTDVVGVRRTRGWLGVVLPAVVVTLTHPHLPTGRTMWCRILHASWSFMFPRHMILLCATLDVGCGEIHQAIELHLGHLRK